MPTEEYNKVVYWLSLLLTFKVISEIFLCRFIATVAIASVVYDFA